MQQPNQGITPHAGSHRLGATKECITGSKLAYLVENTKAKEGYHGQNRDYSHLSNNPEARWGNQRHVIHRTGRAGQGLAGMTARVRLLLQDAVGAPKADSDT
jgi:hypothetical protein